VRILISDKAHASCAQKFQEAGFDVDEKTGLSPDELKAVIKDYDGLVIRSATKITADLLEAAQNLKVVGRAGTGLDNVDIPAATAKNVVVMNTPGQNSNAAAELAVAMLFALARHLPRACASLKDCKWEKKQLQGREIMGKTLGIVGFGNIGQIVGPGKRRRSRDLRRSAGAFRFYYHSCPQDRRHRRSFQQRNHGQDERRSLPDQLRPRRDR